MADRPILFQPAMIRAILDDRKTQTRRILKPQPYPLEGRPGFWNASGCVGGRIVISDEDLLALHRYCVGDRLWCREAWRTFISLDGTPPRDLLIRPEGQARGAAIRYEAGGGLAITADGTRYYGEEAHPHDGIGKLRPGMFMPRWASRLTLPVTKVRLERLQDISEEDALAEGVEYETADPPFYYVPGIWPHSITGTEIRDGAAACFRKLWEHINGAASWAANPWVSATTFTAEQRNIDAEAA